MQILSFRADQFGGWLKVCGYGFGWRDARKIPLSFSERNGRSRVLQCGRVILKPFAP